MSLLQMPYELIIKIFEYLPYEFIIKIIPNKKIYNLIKHTKHNIKCQKYIKSILFTSFIKERTINKLLILPTYYWYNFHQIEYVKFIYSYNIKVIPTLSIVKNKLKHIQFSHVFNEILSTEFIDNMPFLETIIFNDSYNQPLPSNFKNLKSLQNLTFGYHYSKPLDNLLPQTLKFLTISNNYNHPLPDNLIINYITL